LNTGTLGNMRSNVAITGFPFQRRIGTSCAKPPRRKFSAAITAVAFFHDFMANPAVVDAPFSSHKRAIKTFSNRCTFHRNHPLSIGFGISHDEFIDLEFINNFGSKKGPGISDPGPTRQTSKFGGNIVMSTELVNKKRALDF